MGYDIVKTYAGHKDTFKYSITEHCVNNKKHYTVSCHYMSKKFYVFGDYIERTEYLICKWDSGAFAHEVQRATFDSVENAEFAIKNLPKNYEREVKTVNYTESHK